MYTKSFKMAQILWHNPILEMYPKEVVEHKLRDSPTRCSIFITY